MVELRLKGELENQKDKFSASILVLVEIMISYCSRKLKEVDGGQKGSSGSFQMKRKGSTIDETNVTNILSKNVNILLSELQNGARRLAAATPGDLRAYERYSKTSTLTNLPGNVASLIANISVSFPLVPFFGLQAG